MNQSVIKLLLLFTLKVSIVSLLSATPLSGTYTIGGSSADFATFKLAESALTTNGVNGAVIFEVQAGLVFYEAPVILTNIPGNDLYPITFRKSGTGSNPKIYGRNGTGNYDAVITLKGVNHITIDGIDVSDTSTNTTNLLRMEFGYKVINSSPTQGSSFNIIRNTRISLNRTNMNTCGIAQSVSSVAGGFTPSASEGANHCNRYENIRVTNSYNGIELLAHPVFPDSLNVITSTGNDTTIIGSLNANDIGNGDLEISGILLVFQNSPEISYCVIRNLTSTRSRVTGIFISNTSSFGNYYKTIIKHNRIYNLNIAATRQGFTDDAVFGITLQLGTNMSALVTNNIIYNLSKVNIPSSSNAIQIMGICHNNDLANGNAEYYHNSVSVTSGNSTNISSVAFYKDGAGRVVSRNNMFINTTGDQSGNARHFGVYYNSVNMFTGIPTGNNNLIWASNNNGYVGGRSASYAQTLTDWKTLTGQEARSISYLPALSLTDHLKPVASDSSTWALNGRALHLDSTLVRTDINNVTRPLTKADGVPDIGAYEFTPTSLPPAATAVGALAQGSTQVFLFGEDTVARVKWNAGNIPSSISVRQYTGTKPTGISGAEPFMYFYTRTDADQSVAYDFDLDLVYQDAWLGTVTAEPNLRMAQTQANSFWAMTDASGTSVDTVLNIITALHLDTFSLFTGTDMNTPLPVSMIAFEGRLQSDDVLLKWITASETNNKGFAVERSVDGKRWTYIGFVNGMGNTNTKQYYNYTDRTPFSNNIPVLHYRLRQVDVNGKTSYSDIVSVRKDAVENVSMNVYPNPFDHAFTLSVDALNNGALLIELYDIQGRLAESFTKTVNKGANHVLINNLEHLQQGVYFIKTTIDGETSVQKLIRQ